MKRIILTRVEKLEQRLPRPEEARVIHVQFVSTTGEVVSALDIPVDSRRVRPNGKRR
jgi:hypothetical protein